MNYSISERQALNILNIDDFRQMSKDKIVKFLSISPNMDPEIAKAAIAQFPNFTDLSKDVINHFSNSIIKLSENATETTKISLMACQSIIDSLREELNNENIDSNERSRIEDNMLQAARLMSEINKEHSKAMLNNVGLMLAGFLAALGLAVSALGNKLQFKSFDDANHHTEQ